MANRRLSAGDNGAFLVRFVKLMLVAGAGAAVAALLLWPLGGDGLAWMGATIGFWAVFILALVSPKARGGIGRLGDGLFSLGAAGIFLLVGAGIGAGIAAWFADGLMQSGVVMDISNSAQWMIVLAGAALGVTTMWWILTAKGRKIIAEEQAQAVVSEQMAEEGRSEMDGDHLRGAKIAAASDVAKLTGKEECRAKLGSVPIPARVEPYHFLLSGGTGAGKSQAFFQLMEGTRERGQRAVVVDVGGEFLRRFWRPGDTVLNPTDARSVPWSPLAEMREPWDSDKLSKSMIPDAQGAEKEWAHYSQVLVSGVLRRMAEAGEARVGEFVRLMTVAENEELAALLEGLPASVLFGKGADRMLASVRGIVGTHLAPYAYLPEAGEDAFSVRKWVEQEGDSWLFITVRDDQLATLKPLISAWVDIAISALLSLEPSSTRRLWFLLDEFATLGRIQSIEALLTKARKQGGVGVLGLQSISQLRETYGQHTAQTLLSCLGTWLVLRAPDAETAEYMSKYLGDEEVRRVLESMSHNSSFQQSTSGESWQEQVQSRRLVMPGQLQSLPDLKGILNLVGSYPVCWVVIPVSQIPVNRAEAFIEREHFRVAAKPVVEQPKVGLSELDDMLGL